MDFGVLPPEINSGRMYAGPGSGPMLAAAAAWDGLATELQSTAADYGSVISGPWRRRCTRHWWFPRRRPSHRGQEISQGQRLTGQAAAGGRAHDGEARIGAALAHRRGRAR